MPLCLVRLSRFFLRSSALSLLLACGVTDPTGGLPPGDAQLAILNALPVGAVAGLTLDDTPLPLPASQTRISRVITAGEHRLEARGAGGRVVASVQFGVNAGGRRIAIIGGSLVGGGSLLIAADTATIPPESAAKIRVINSVQGTPELEAWLVRLGQAVDSTARLASPLPYGTSVTGSLAAHVLRGPGSYRVRVTDRMTGSLQAERDVTLWGGDVWSVILIRRSDGELALVAIQEA